MIGAPTLHIEIAADGFLRVRCDTDATRANEAAKLCERLMPELLELQAAFLSTTEEVAVPRGAES